jgi:hypothetical protein
LTQIDDHPTCPACKYDLHGLAGDPVRCPECGAMHAREVLARGPRRDFATPICLPFAVVGGLAIGTMICLLGHEVDVGRAFWLWLSAIAALNAAFAFIAPRHFWIWPMVIAFGQLFAFLGPYGLGPFAPAVLFVYTLPMYLPALIGAGSRRFLSRRHNSSGAL